MKQLNNIMKQAQAMQAKMAELQAGPGGHVPVLLLGGRYDVAPYAGAVGVDACLAKPFDIDAFVVAVARLAGLPQEDQDPYHS